MKSFAFNSDFDVRRGIERWENEGGLIRLGTAVPSHSNRPSDADHWMRDLPHNFREAGLSVWSNAPTNSLLGSKKDEDMKENKCAAVLLGPPGSGKTTLVRSLAAANRISVIETGNLLKREVRLQTPLGRKIRPYTDSGDLVPSEWVEQIISAHLASVQSELVLFDGFPRCGEQIELFFELLKSQQLDLCAVLVLTLDLQTAIKRLSGRRICTKCGALYHVYSKPPNQAGKCDQCGGVLTQRDDDRAEVIQQRFKSYERETMPVIESFRNEFEHLIWEESSTTPLDQVADRVGQRLEKLTRQ